MTSDEKKTIDDLRARGLGYVRIAREIGIPENTVKSYIRRSGRRADTSGGATEIKPCLCCGKPVKQNPHRKEKRFCSDACRMKWWNEHPDRVNKKAVYEYKCPQCGRPFTAYGNSKRKYCSHQCYIEARFGGDCHDQ